MSTNDTEKESASADDIESRHEQPETVDPVLVSDGFFRRHGRKIVIVAVLTIFLGVPLILAALKFQQKIQLEPSVFYFLEEFFKYSLMTAGIFWFFFFGASFGSFLNVIAWRLPRGGTLLGSSYCQSCNTKLKMWDNFPLFGWLWLRGKCRYCEMRISGRYLIVEFVAAIGIGLLAIIEIIGSGVNLLEPTNSEIFSFERLVLSPELRFIGYFLLHSCLIFILMTSALVRSQQQQIPRNIFFFGFLVSITTAIFWPQAIPFSHTGQEIPSVASMFTSTLSMICGLCSGGILGLVYTCLLMKKSFREHPEDTILMALTGSFLGWQATVITGFLVGIILLLMRIFSKKHSMTELLWLSALITIFTFRFWMEPFRNWLSGNTI